MESLERKQGSGRPKILSSTQVKNYIQIPFRNKNRSHQPVHYTQLLPSVQKKKPIPMYCYDQFKDTKKKSLEQNKRGPKKGPLMKVNRHNI